MKINPRIEAARPGLNCAGCSKKFHGTYHQARRALANENVYCGKKCRMDALRKSSFYTTPIGNKAYEQ